MSYNIGGANSQQPRNYNNPGRNSVTANYPQNYISSLEPEQRSQLPQLDANSPGYTASKNREHQPEKSTPKQNLDFNNSPMPSSDNLINDLNELKVTTLLTSNKSLITNVGDKDFSNSSDSLGTSDPVFTTTIIEDNSQEEYVQQKIESVQSIPQIVDPTFKDGLPSDCYLDFEEINQTLGYDDEQGSSRIPPRLYKMIVHPKESIVYLALCGVSIVGYNPQVIKMTILDLRKYLNFCTSAGYIEESDYIKNIIDNIKAEAKTLKTYLNTETPDLINEKLDVAQETLKQRESTWQRKSDELNTQLQIALKNLQLSYEEEEEKLNEEWSSNRKRSQYNKPSHVLLELRRKAKYLLSTRKFQDLEILNKQIDKQEQYETEEAIERMKEGYEKAQRELDRKYEADKESLNLLFTRRQNDLETAKQKSMTPTLNRIKHCQLVHEHVTQKHEIITKKLQNSRPVTSSTNYNKLHIKKLNNKKLKLPRISYSKPISPLNKSQK